MTKYEEYKNKINDIQYIFLSGTLDLIDCQYVLTLIYESIFTISHDLVFDIKNVFSKIELNDELPEQNDITDVNTYLQLFWAITRDINNYNTILDATKKRMESVLTALEAAMDAEEAINLEEVKEEKNVVQKEIILNNPLTNNCVENCASCSTPCTITAIKDVKPVDNKIKTTEILNIQDNVNSVKNSPLSTSNLFNKNYLKDYFIHNNILKNECSICGLVEWQNNYLQMHLDFIDGDYRNQNLSNVRLLCPNCYSQIGHAYE